MLFDLFENFKIEDFELYKDENSSLPLYNSKRFMVFKKLEALGEKIKTVFPQLTFEVSHPAPSVWNSNSVKEQVLYFIRKNSEQKKLETFITKEISIKGYMENPSIFHNHIMAGVIVSSNGLSVVVDLNKNAVIDYRNFENKIENRNLLEQLFNFVKEGDILFQNNSFENFETFEKVVLDTFSNKDNFSFSYFYPKDSSKLEDSEFLAEIKEKLQNLKPIFEFINWTTLNDHIFIKDKVSKKVIEDKKGGLNSGDQVMILSGFFEGRKGGIVKVSKNSTATIDINGIKIKLDVSKLAKI